MNVDKLFKPMEIVDLLSLVLFSIMLFQLSTNLFIVLIMKIRSCVLEAQYSFTTVVSWTLELFLSSFNEELVKQDVHHSDEFCDVLL